MADQTNTPLRHLGNGYILLTNINFRSLSIFKMTTPTVSLFSTLFSFYCLVMVRIIIVMHGNYLYHE